MPEDTISKELRAVEEEVDCHYRQNALVKEPFGRAGWYFLAFCEERYLLSIIRDDDPFTEHEYAALVDNIIIHAQWPLRWLTQTCSPGGEIPRTYEENLYSAAWELSELAMRYRSFAAAFSFATWGLATLSLDGHRIKSSSPMRSDTRFEAYDRLILHEIPPTLLDMDTAFSARIRASVRVRGDWFDYNLTPQVVQSGLEALTPFIDLRFELPTDWQFPRFSLIQFRQVARVLWVLAFTHFQARVSAAELGCQGLGFSRALLLMGNDELLRRVRRSISKP
jgi:hypothetical protein